MTTYKLLAAATLGLALAACGGQQRADETAAQSPAAGEMPQAGDTGTVTGSPETNTMGTDTATPGATTGDAGTMGTDTMGTDPSTTGTDNPARTPTESTDPALESTTPPADQQQTTPPPPTQ